MDQSFQVETSSLTEIFVVMTSVTLSSSRVRGHENRCGVIRVREAVGGCQIECSCSKVGQSVGSTKSVCVCVRASI